MQTPDQTDWNETKDPGIVDWKRVRAAIEHENLLTNQRVTWLLIGQGFLFGAYMAVFAPIAKGEIEEEMLPYALGSLAVIVLAGVSLSVFLSKGVKAAFEQHNHLSKWWNDRPKSDTNRHPQICGEEPTFSSFVIPYYQFPVLFLPVWLLLLSFAGFKFLQAVQVNINLNALILLVLLFVFSAIVLLFGVWIGNRVREKRG